MTRPRALDTEPRVPGERASSPGPAELAARIATASTPPPASRSVEGECGTFTRYLTGLATTPYVLERYAQAVGSLPSSDGKFDNVLLRIAASGTARTRLADAYARFFRPTGALRTRLVTLLAILETTPPYYQRLEAIRPSGPLIAMVRVAGTVAAGALVAIAAAALFLPLQLVLRGRR